MTTNRVAVYSRVSTHHGQDPELQLRELREYTASRGLTIVQEYTDVGYSGSKESRPALNQLMADARRRRFDAVLVWKLDRFGRSLRHLVNALAELEALGLSFISLRDNLDLSTPSGRLMFQIIGAMAEFERSLIQERVKAGLRNAKAKGKRLGRPRVVVDETAIFAMRDSGASWRTISGKLGIGVGTAHRIAQSRSKNLCGTFTGTLPGNCGGNSIAEVGIAGRLPSEYRIRNPMPSRHPVRLGEANAGPEGRSAIGSSQGSLTFG